MELELEAVTYRRESADDGEVLARLPVECRALLAGLNGFVAYGGGLHVRGAVHQPEWHSIRAAWEGPLALHALYPAVEATDVPFAQDAFGDQYVLREGLVYHLSGESGELTSLGISLAAFLERAAADPVDFLNLTPLEGFRAQGGCLLPGQLLCVYPPFITKEAAAGVSLRAMAVAERLTALAALAQQLREVRDEATIRLDVVP